jgi:hypothetical protein
MEAFRSALTASASDSHFCSSGGGTIGEIVTLSDVNGTEATMVINLAGADLPGVRVLTFTNRACIGLLANYY